MYERRSACGVTRRLIPTDLASRVTIAAALRRCMRLPHRLSSSGPSVRPGLRLVDRLVRPWIQRHLGGLVALADDPQRRLVPRAAEIAHVRTARFGHPQPVQSEQTDQRVAVAAFVLGCREEVGQFVAVQPRLRPSVAAWPPHASGGLPTLISSSSSQVNHDDSVEIRRRRVEFANAGTCCSSWRRYTSTCVRRTPT